LRPVNVWGVASGTGVGWQKSTKKAADKKHHRTRKKKEKKVESQSAKGKHERGQREWKIS
jgi:hypothetical protein